MTVFLSFSGNVFLLVAAALPVLYIVSGIYYAFFHPLASVPGPKICGASQLPYIYHLICGDAHKFILETHKKYGPVARITPREVSFTSYEAMKKIYGQKTGINDSTFEKDIRIYGVNHGAAANILTASNEDHRRIRRLLSHAFSEKALRNQEYVLKRYADRLVSRMGDHAKEGRIVDMARWFNFFTFDLVGDLAFGQPFGGLDTGGYHPWVAMVFENVRYITYKQIACRLGIEQLVWYLAPAKVKQGYLEHFELSKQTAMRRIKSGNLEREDFMSYILRHNDAMGMTEDEISETANVLIMAGSETTASILSGTVFHLCSNPGKYKKLVHEIRSAFKSEDEITLSRINHLEYLIAVFNEGGRLYPPAPTPFPRVSPPGGEEISGYWIPEGTTVHTAHYCAFRYPGNFKDPLVFAPERWLNDPQFEGDSLNVLQPFSMGPRNCIGKNLAYAEMRLALAHLLYKFDLELLPESKAWDQQKVFIFWEKNVLNIKLTPVS